MPSPPPTLVATLFAELAELARPARAIRLAEIARDDASLAGELRALLDADEQAGDFLGVLAGDGHDVASAAALHAEPPAARIGPYRLLRLLGRGGMATVWLAHDERLDRPVALKVLDETGATTAGARERFLVEARAAAGLDHPHVAVVHDLGETPDGVRYIAMAYYEGGTLAERLARGPLHAADAIRTAGQLADALQAAHARGIVHRDVKPANVLFDAAGQVRLADFGIAKLADADAVQTRPGLVLGTVAYLAPEQVRGERADHRADLWALGVTLYEMLAGCRPFSGDSHTAVMHAVLSTDPVPPSHHAADVPPALDALVLRLLRKDASERPVSAGEVRCALADDAAALAPDSPPAAAAPPVPLTPLVGRAHELALGAELIGRARLVTLTGPGGTGKTRLAFELAQRAAGRYADGIFVVELASTARPALVPSTVGQALGLREMGPERAEALVTRWFATREALLVLDNFEHVLDAAPFVATLLAAAPRLTVLVTSRAPLRLLGEQELPVPPLLLPAEDASSVEDVGEAEAVRLFVERARAGRPDFALDDGNAADVAALCRRLDGLPLAIELAAARARLLSPRALRARIEQRLDVLRTDARDVAPRHRTLRDVIDWSYTLLRPDEQALFAELAVVVGGFGLDAVEAIARGTPYADEMDALDHVASLCDKSLLVRREQPDGEPRFAMLETVREFGLERLRESGREAIVREYHRTFFLALAEEAARHLRGPRQVEWLQRLAQEHDNLRAAIDDALAADDFDAAVRCAIALHRFWLVTHRHLGEALERLRALERRIASDPTRATRAQHAALLTALGLLTGVRSEIHAAYDYFRDSLRAFRDVGDAAGIATTLNHVGWNAFILGEYDEAVACTTEALAMHRAAGNEGGVGIALVNLAWVDERRGDLRRAEERFSEALAVAQRRQDRRSVAYVVDCLSTLVQVRGDHARAIALSEEAIRLTHGLGDRMFGPVVEARLAAIWRDLGRLPQARALLVERVIPPLRAVSFTRAVAYALVYLGAVDTDLGFLDEARAVLEESLAWAQQNDRSTMAGCEALLAEVERRGGACGAARARWRTALHVRAALGETVGVAGCLEGIARLAADLGDDVAAASLIAGAARTREVRGAPLAPIDREAQEVLLATLRARLGDAFAPAYAAGAAVPPDALVARALALDA